MLGAFRKVDPRLEGMVGVEESVRDQLTVIEGLGIEDSGRFMSHHGNRDWF